MGQLAQAHRGRSKDLPPRELLEPHIERTESHWYWLLDFVDDGLRRSAVFSWAPLGQRGGQFMVPRLLWQLAHLDELPARLLLENTCGLYTCINPDHWRKRRGVVEIPARIVLPDSVDAMPVLKHASMDHLLNVHIRRVDSLNTVCGKGRDYRVLAKTSVVTCDECISVWIRTGQPYKVVP